MLNNDIYDQGSIFRYRLIFFTISFLFFCYVGYEIGKYVQDLADKDVNVQLGATTPQRGSDYSTASGEHSDLDSSSLEYFPNTGYWIGGKIKEYYHSIYDAEEIIGCPISEEYYDETSGLQTQYFEKAILKIYSTSAGDEYVGMSRLGAYYYVPGEKLEISQIGGCKLFEGSPNKVCFEFLEFYEQHGGVDIFGLPISEFELSDGWIVQYFENSRIEWKPNVDGENNVVVSNLGALNFYSQNSLAKEQKTISNNIPIQIDSISISVTPGSPTVQIGDDLEIYITVVDQLLKPVEEALLVYSIYYPDGSEYQYFPGSTSGIGINISEVIIKSEICGNAKIVVAAGYGDIMNEAENSIKIFCP
jgi:hypothetical protein